MDNWEKTKTVGSLLSAVALPVVLLVVGNQLSSATKEREIQSKFVELSTQILRETPTEESRPLRQWATQIIDRYSGVPLPQQTAASLIEKTVLPATPTTVEPVATAGAATWAVVFGGDSSFDDARSEISIAASKHDIQNASIYLRNGSYRSVFVAKDRSEAADVLGRAQQRRADAYIVNMNSWCPQVESRDGYNECVPR